MRRALKKKINGSRCREKTLLSTLMLLLQNHDCTHVYLLCDGFNERQVVPQSTDLLRAEDLATVAQKFGRRFVVNRVLSVVGHRVCTHQLEIRLEGLKKKIFLKYVLSIDRSHIT